MVGRKPKPTRLKLLQGNPGKRPVNRREPQPAAQIPDCPEHLSEVAKHEWRRVAVELSRLGLLTLVDRAALSAYCCVWARWVEAEDHLKKTGPVVRSPSGYPIQNPYLAIANAALSQMRAFLIEFGMTPSSRSRVTGPPAEGVDPVEELLFGTK